MTVFDECLWCAKYDDDKHRDYEQERGCADYACENCERVFDSSDAYGDEPIGHTLDDGEYKAFVDSYNDVFLLKSPYFTYAQFCSPCVPGAGHLSHPLSADSGAPKVYCFDGSWFNGNQAPYDVYEVATGKLVEPQSPMEGE